MALPPLAPCSQVLNVAFSGVALHDAVSVGHFAAHLDLGPEVLFARVQPLLEGRRRIRRSGACWAPCLTWQHSSRNCCKAVLFSSSVRALLGVATTGSRRRPDERRKLQVHQRVHEVRGFLFQLHEQFRLGDFLLRQKVADFNHRDARVAGESRDRPTGCWRSESSAWCWGPGRRPAASGGWRACGR